MRRWHGEERRDWLMIAAASLAGGAAMSLAVSNATAVLDAARERFPEEDDLEDDAAGMSSDAQFD